MEDAANPVNPTSVGALLAEEYTMSPFTPLPSFLEMMMIEETASSARRALLSVLNAVVERASSISSSLPSTDAGFWNRLRFRMARLLEYAGSNYSPEIRMIILYMMEIRCLKSNACATLSESMFGAKRARLGDVQPNGNRESSQSYRKVLPLRNRDRTRLALLVVLGPYAKERLDMLFRRLKQVEQAQPSSTTTAEHVDQWTRLRDKLRSIFVLAYPFLHMTHEGTMLAYEWSYFVGRSLYFSPSSHLLSLIVRRVTTADMTSGREKNKTPTASGQWESALRRLRLAAVASVSIALVLGWLSQLRNELRRRRRQGLPTENGAQSRDAIPPPKSPPLHMDESDRIRPLPDDSSLCPLCRQPRINPAVSTSGHVFCYRCLVLYVRQHGTCPLTGRSCPESRIVRIYEPDP